MQRHHPLEAKKILFMVAVTEGIGYLQGKREHGMNTDFIDETRIFTG